MRLNAQKKPVTKGDINEILFSENHDKVRGWFMVKDRLAENGYIKYDRDKDFMFLTQKSIRLIQKHEEKDNVLSRDDSSSERGSSLISPIIQKRSKKYSNGPELI